MRARRGAAVAAGLAALAESCVWFFPVAAVSGTLGGALDPTFADLAAFAGAFAAATVASVLAGAGRTVTVGLLLASAAIGVAEGAGTSTAQPGGMIVALIAAGALGARAGTLALRDWREPIAGSFVLGALGLLVAAAGSGFAGHAGGRLMAAALPVFFLGSLASRAASVRLARGWDARDGRRVGVALGVVGAAMGLAALFGGTTGLFRWVGGLVAPPVGFVASGILLVITWIATPFLWLADRFSIDLRGLQRALRQLRAGVEEGTAGGASGAGALQRVLGIAFIALVMLGVLLLYRRIRDRSVPAIPRGAPDAVTAAAIEGGDERAVPWAARASRRRRMPAETVRRWYAEALESLARLRLDRAPARTPAEFAGEVALAYPEAGAPFRALTRAYERTRYGLVAATDEELRELRAGREHLMRELKRAEPLPEPGP
ncbi:MAG: DUF4129 domain-containing protein [Actinomycetota bacterium]